MTGSRVMTIFVYKGLTRNRVLTDIWIISELLRENQQGWEGSGGLKLPHHPPCPPPPPPKKKTKKQQNKQKEKTKKIRVQENCLDSACSLSMQTIFD